MLKHELTHSFVRLITLGHCPTWFNEGLAQLEEGSTSAALGEASWRARALPERFLRLRRSKYLL